jgi:hypothetical protein
LLINKLIHNPVTFYDELPMKNTAPFKKALINWTLALFAVLLCLGVLEILLRFSRTFDPFPYYAVGERQNREHKNFMADPRIGWKMKPGVTFRWDAEEFQSVYFADSSGFRAPGSAAPDTAAGSCWILVGDSYSFGTFVDYEETFCAHLDDAFPGVRVLNRAQPGFGVDQMLFALEESMKENRCELTIIGLVDADFKRSMTAYRAYEGWQKRVFGLENGKLFEKTEKDKPNALYRWFDQKSRVYMGFKLVRRRLGYSYPIGPWWKVNAAIMDSISSLAAGSGSGVLFVNIPTNSWREFPMLRRFMEEREYHFVDIRSEYRGDPRELYYRTDAHLSPRGHEIVAGILKNKIEEMGFR